LVRTVFKTKPTSIRLDPETEKMIEELKERLKLSSKSSVVRIAVLRLYEEEIKKSRS